MCLDQDGGLAGCGNAGQFGNARRYANGGQFGNAGRYANGGQVDNFAGNGNGYIDGNQAGYAPVKTAGAAAPAAPVQNGGAPAEANEKALFEIVNRVRQQLGLNPLVYDESLSPIARRSAQARTHTNTGGTSEIIAWGQGSPEQAIETWRNSPAHWNILTSPNLSAMGPGWVGDGAGITFR